MDDIRQKIADRRLPAGAKLPPTRELAEEYGVTQQTIHRAIAFLKSGGHVLGLQGKGVFVRMPRQLVTRQPQLRYQWEKARARYPEEERATTGVSEYDTGRDRDDFDFPAVFSPVLASAELADRFGVAKGTVLLQRLYRTTVREEQHPVALISSYLLYSVAEQNPDLLDAEKEPWPGGTMNQLWTVGIEIDHIIDEITTRAPTPEEAETLGLADQMAVFVLEKTSISVAGDVVEFSEVILPGDRTRMKYTIQLERWTT
ncbi:GntR family transcriptional regulator [Streptomyces buecherae]|uniref:GntR family transcriptional regulator n=1 Tax=Streptomyces buecherae TaxID=2763006 RepID=A0A7H8NKD2_9ACTN|nr:GntR family transcriptional regulator [Streptomyces buecherae]QKW55034.1 GntR family transcriptional regulator [Streptomyces buecherae]